MGIGDHLIEEPVAVAGTRQGFLMGGKPVVDVGEHSAGYLVDADSVVIILWTGDRKRYIYYLIGEERGNDDETCPAELLVPP